NTVLDLAQLTEQEQFIVRWIEMLQQDYYTPFINNSVAPIASLSAEQQVRLPLVKRNMGIPIMEGERVIVLTIVANKSERYNDADLRQLRLLVDSMWKLLQQQQTQEQAISLVLEKERVNIMTDFIQDASHEFRTPLSNINTSIYMIRKQADNSALDKYLDDLRERSDYIDYLLDRMLVLLRLDSAPDSYPMCCNVNKMLGSIESDLRYDFAAAGLTLALNLDETLPDCFGYMQLLHQALNEIVDNARHYTPTGGIVTLTTGYQEKSILVTVADTGIGINPEDLPRIFENFFRADKARTERHAGMGLTIARRIVEIHHGRITVESLAGAGSTFCIELPARQLDELADPVLPAVDQT
ncbi:sensor histidine kinase, partial [Chloroflexota bacterium]